MASLLHRCLAHPLTKGMSVDDPRTTALRRDIILSKPFLRQLYVEWYTRLARITPPNSTFLELGSGGGFFRDFVPNLITSELFPTPGVERVVDAHQLPFEDGLLDGIVMTDVLHHIPDVRRFFREASRCVKTAGAILMIEPWNTPWSKWVYQHLHTEPFDPAGGWTISSSGPLSGANGALPWIVFERDRRQFEQEFKHWAIKSIEPLMPFSYLMSGGVSLRSLMPGWAYRPCRWFESRLNQTRWGMFALIELTRL